MSRQWKYSWLALGLVATTTAAVWLPAEAEARSPQQSTLVLSTDVSLTSTQTRDDEPSTIYAGIEECSTLANNNPDMNVYIETTQFMENPDLFGGVYHYNYPRGEERTIACRTAEGTLHDDCEEELTGDAVTVIGNDVDISVDFETLTGFTSADDCVEGEHDQSYYVQLRLRRPAATGVGFGEWSYEEARLVVDLIRPEAPTLNDAMTTENSIYVEFQGSESDDVDAHHVVFSTSPFSAGDEVGDMTTRVVTGTEDGRVGGVSFQAGTTVYVAMAALDRARNFSVVTEPIETTVIQTNTFWDYYRGAGGAEGGYGCQNSASSSANSTLVFAVASLMALFGVAHLRRRRTEIAAVVSKETRR